MLNILQCLYLTWVSHMAMLCLGKVLKKSENLLSNLGRNPRQFFSSSKFESENQIYSQLVEHYLPCYYFMKVLVVNFQKFSLLNYEKFMY